MFQNNLKCFETNLKCFGIIFMGNFLLQTKLFEICSKTNLNVLETFELFRKRLEMNKNSIYWKLFIWNQLKQMADLLMGRARPQTSAAPAPTRSFLRCDRIKSHEAIYRRAPCIHRQEYQIRHLLQLNGKVLKWMACGKLMWMALSVWRT